MQQTYTGTFTFNAVGAHDALYRLTSKRHGAKPISGLYAITNTRDGCAYIGSSEDVMRRWKTHEMHLRHGKHPNDHLQHAYDVDGDTFTFTIIEHTPNTVGLMRKEEAMANDYGYDAINLYNYRLGNRFINGWTSFNSNGSKSGGYKPRSRHTPNSVTRWYDKGGNGYAQA